MSWVGFLAFSTVAPITYSNDYPYFQGQYIQSFVYHYSHSFLNSFNAYSTPADSLKAAGIQRGPTSNIQPPVTAVESSSTRYSEPVVIKMSPPLAVKQEEPKFDPYADDIDPYAVSPRMQVDLECQMGQKCCREW